jgi:ribonuclease HI
MIFKLFTDGNSFPRAKRSGFGGYIQSPEGEPILEFTEQVRESQYMHSFEILGIIRGLKLALQYGIKNIVSYCDDKNTTQRLIEIFDQGVYAVSKEQKPELYNKVIELSKEFDSISFQYIPRENNKRADHLSRRYAKTMENSWLTQYQHDLDTSAINIARNLQPKRRAFFSHPNIVRMIHKGNPFLVVPQRSKMVRRVLRAEDKTQFHYVFVEYFSNKNHIKLKTSLYTYDGQCLLCQSSDNEGQQMDETKILDFFHQSILNMLNTVNQDFPAVKNVWINSNNFHIMSYLEQCEKIPSKNWNVFSQLFNAMDNFERVIFHHLPFQPQLDMCPPKPISEKKMSYSEKLEKMIVEYHEIENQREKKRKLGQLICHTLKEQKKQGVFMGSIDTLKQEIEKLVA